MSDQFEHEIEEVIGLDGACPADDAGDGTVAERRHQAEHVAHFVQRSERREVVVEFHIRP